jgi:hypothetical protein
MPVGVGEGDHRFVELGVVGDLADLDREGVGKISRAGIHRQGRQRRQTGTHHCGCTGRSRSRRWCRFDAGAVQRHAHTGRRVAAHRDRLGGGVVELGAATRRGAEVVADHLLLDRVDLGLDAGVLLGATLGHRQAAFRVVQPRGSAECRQLFGRQALAAHLAQHVELALADEVVAPLALDHRLQLGLGELGLARLVLRRADLGPFRGRIGHELDDLAKEARGVFGFRHDG